MAKTAVKDVVIWSKHIHGDDVAAHLSALRGGDVVDLLVDGWHGSWCKMSNGKDGRPTEGIRPIGPAQACWKALYASRRGEIVEVRLAPSETESKAVESRTPSSADRSGAFAQLRTFMRAGHRSDGRTLTRDEMHER